MKNKIVLLFVLICSHLLAQDSTFHEDKLKSRFRPGIMWNYTGLKPAKEGKGFKYDRLMFDVTYNDWAGDRTPFKVQGPSMGMNVSFMFDIPMNKKGTVSFGVGPQYGFYNIRHDLAYAFNFDQDFTTLDTPENVGAIGHVSAVGNFIQAPFEFRFRTKGWSHFKVHLGGKIGYLAAFNHKSKMVTDEYTMVRKDFSTPDLNRLLYSAHIRIGIRNWALYASYNFNPMFKNEQSTQLNQFQMGLTISLY